MSDLDARKFIEHITEDQAHDVLHAIKSKFGWVGTVFVSGDVYDEVREQLLQLNFPELDDNVLICKIRDEVMADRPYRKMADALAERGNEIISDAVAVEIPKHVVWYIEPHGIATGVGIYGPYGEEMLASEAMDASELLSDETHKLVARPVTETVKVVGK